MPRLIISLLTISTMNAQKFNKIDKLYHYTTFDNAIKILLTKSLRFGRLCDMNDINEQYRPFFYAEGSTSKVNEKFYEEIGKYKQISLTKDMHNDGKRFGFDIPAMWGHYADRGKGACIVLDRKKLLNRIKKLQCANNDIVYDRKHDNNVTCNNILAAKDVEKFLKDNEEEIFFYKSEDWSYEQEYRIITNNPDISHLSISGCILCILIRDREWNDSMRREEILKKTGCHVYFFISTLSGGVITNGTEHLFPSPIARIAAPEEWKDLEYNN